MYPGKILQDLEDNGIDNETRRSPDSWNLFRHLIGVVPLPNAARMLGERKFMAILRQTLEEAQKAASDRMSTNIPDVRQGNEERSLKTSKKRNRSGELISSSIVARNDAQKLPTAIFAAMHQLTRLTTVTFDMLAGERSTTFSTEYMKSVIRISAEDAAKILGAWLSLCRISLNETPDTVTILSYLSPACKIWDFRIAGDEDLMHFSLYCSEPLLFLLKALKTREATSDVWIDDLEQLVARNVMIPAKAARLGNADSDLLSTLTRLSVIQDSANAPILFDVAIRSIQAQRSSRRRRPHDESWLQTVFAALKDAMPVKRAEENGKAIRQMLQGAISYKVVLDLTTLHSVTSQYCLLESNTNWDLLATIIKLDANVLLIPYEDKSLVQQVLARITAVSLEKQWPEISREIVSEVVVPLMSGFANARDLSTFIRHWHSRIVELEKVRSESPSLTMASYSAWEDDALQAEFSKIMEASLTVSQITQLLEWLALQVSESPEATCVILEAMAGSVGREEVVDAVGLRLFHIMFDSGVSEKLMARYKWRSWRILSRTLKWITKPQLEEISVLWEEKSVPFDLLSNSFKDNTILCLSNGNTEKLEILRCVCAAWNASPRGSRLESLSKKPSLDVLHSLSQDTKQFLQDLQKDEELGEEKISSTLNASYQGVGWVLWSSVSCVLVDFSTMLA